VGGGDYISSISFELEPPMSDWFTQQGIVHAKLLHQVTPESEFEKEWAKRNKGSQGVALPYMASAFVLLLLASLGLLASFVILGIAPTTFDDVILIGVYAILLIAATMALSGVLYALRLTRPVIYGTIEIGVGILLAMVYSLSFASGKGVNHILIGLLSEIGAIYIIIRGMDNIAKVKAVWEAFFIEEIANRLWNRNR
jgi:hypothetical protein